MIDRGIEATKLNFSNSESRKVLITLTPDRSALTYTTLEERKGCLGCFLGPKKTTIPLSDFKYLVYGGRTSTFLAH